MGAQRFTRASASFLSPIVVSGRPGRVTGPSQGQHQGVEQAAARAGDGGSVDLDATARLRHEYGARSLSRSDLAASWWDQFSRWFDEAAGLGGGPALDEPNAMVVATVDAAGRPRARTVLLKSMDARGFVWASNYRSRKGRDLAGSGRAGLLFPWHDLQRQVHAEGPVAPTDAAESDRIWAARPRLSRLSALASHQSEIVDSRATLDQRLAALDAEYGDEVPRPAHWGGYRLHPETVEFWQGGRNRLHDRLRFRLVGAAADPAGWIVERLEP
jgi:pyridoxamine 5'-phosphate oxidase